MSCVRKKVSVYARHVIATAAELNEWVRSLMLHGRELKGSELIRSHVLRDESYRDGLLAASRRVQPLVLDCLQKEEFGTFGAVAMAALRSDHHGARKSVRADRARTDLGLGC